MSSPVEAIPNLILAGANRIAPRKEVIIALGEYTNEQLDPYYNCLVPLIMEAHNTLPLTREVKVTLDKLVPYVTNPAKFGPPCQIRND